MLINQPKRSLNYDWRETNNEKKRVLKKSRQALSKRKIGLASYPNKYPNCAGETKDATTKKERERDKDLHSITLAAKKERQSTLDDDAHERAGPL